MQAIPYKDQEISEQNRCAYEPTQTRMKSADMPKTLLLSLLNEAHVGMQFWQSTVQTVPNSKA